MPRNGITEHATIVGLILYAQRLWMIRNGAQVKMPERAGKPGLRAAGKEVASSLTKRESTHCILHPQLTSLAHLEF